MRWLILLFFSLVSSQSVSQTAEACRCLPLDSAKAFESADQVYFAKTLEMRTDEEGKKRQYFHILQTLKGERPSQDTWAHIHRGSTCDASFKEGELRILYIKDGDLKKCMGNIDLLSQLDEGFSAALIKHSQHVPHPLNPQLHLSALISSDQKSEHLPPLKISASMITDLDKPVGRRAIHLTKPESADLIFHEVVGFKNGYCVFISGYDVRADKRFYIFLAERKDGLFEVLFESLT